jgi:hypothetical protein
MEQIDIWRKRTLTKADEHAENIKKKKLGCVFGILISMFFYSYSISVQAMLTQSHCCLFIL